MDVVRTNIELIGGSVDVKSVSGKGTTFSIKIPLTLAIVSALIVEAGGQKFASVHDGVSLSAIGFRGKGLGRVIGQRLTPIGQIERD